MRLFFLATSVILLAVSLVASVWSFVAIGYFAQHKAPLSSKELRFGRERVNKDEHSLSLGTTYKSSALNLGLRKKTAITAILLGDVSAIEWPLLSSSASLVLQRTQNQSSPFEIKAPGLRSKRLKAQTVTIGSLEDGKLEFNETNVVVEGEVNFRGNMVFLDHLQLVPRLGQEEDTDEESLHGTAEIVMGSGEKAGISMSGSENSLSLILEDSPKDMTKSTDTKLVLDLESGGTRILEAENKVIKSKSIISGLDMISVGSLLVSHERMTNSQGSFTFTGSSLFNFALTMNNGDVNIGDGTKINDQELKGVKINSEKINLSGALEVNGISLAKSTETSLYGISSFLTPITTQLSDLNVGNLLKFKGLRGRGLLLGNLNVSNGIVSRPGSENVPEFSIYTDNLSISRLFTNISSARSLIIPTISMDETGLFVDGDKNLIIESYEKILINPDIIVEEEIFEAEAKYCYSLQIEGTQGDSLILETSDNSSLSLTSSSESFSILLQPEEKLSVTGMLKMGEICLDTTGLKSDNDQIALSIDSPLEIQSLGWDISQLRISDAFENESENSNWINILGNTIEVSFSNLSVSDLYINNSFSIEYCNKIELLNNYSSTTGLSLSVEKSGETYSMFSNSTLEFPNTLKVAGNTIKIGNLVIGLEKITLESPDGTLSINSDISGPEILKLRDYSISPNSIVLLSSNSGVSNPLAFYTTCLSFGDLLSFCPITFSDCINKSQDQTISLESCSPLGTPNSIELGNSDIKAIIAKNMTLGGLSGMEIKYDNKVGVVAKLYNDVMELFSADKVVVDSELVVAESLIIGDFIKLGASELELLQSDEFNLEADLELSITTKIIQDETGVILDIEHVPTDILSNLLDVPPLTQTIIHIDVEGDEVAGILLESGTVIDHMLLAGNILFNACKNKNQLCVEAVENVETIFKTNILSLGEIYLSPEIITTSVTSNSSNSMYIFPHTLFNNLETSYVITSGLDGFFSIENCNSLYLEPEIFKETEFEVTGIIKAGKLEIFDKEDTQIPLVSISEASVRGSNTLNVEKKVLIDSMSVPDIAGLNFAISSEETFNKVLISSSNGNPFSITSPLTFHSAFSNDSGEIGIASASFGSLEYYLEFLSSVSLIFDEVNTGSLVIKNKSISLEDGKSGEIILGGSNSQLYGDNVIILKECHQGNCDLGNSIINPNKSGVADIIFRYEVNSLNEIDGLGEPNDMVVAISEISSYSGTVKIDSVGGAFVASDILLKNIVFSDVAYDNEINFGGIIFRGAQKLILNHQIEVLFSISDETGFCIGPCSSSNVYENENYSALGTLLIFNDDTRGSKILGNDLEIGGVDDNNILIINGNLLSIGGINWSDGTKITPSDINNQIVIENVGVLLENDENIYESSLVLNGNEKKIISDATELSLSSQDFLRIKGIDIKEFKVTEAVRIGEEFGEIEDIYNFSVEDWDNNMENKNNIIISQKGLPDETSRANINFLGGDAILECEECVFDVVETYFGETQIVSFGISSFLSYSSSKETISLKLSNEDTNLEELVLLSGIEWEYGAVKAIISDKTGSLDESDTHTLSFVISPSIAPPDSRSALRLPSVVISRWSDEPGSSDVSKLSSINFGSLLLENGEFMSSILKLYASLSISGFATLDENGIRIELGDNSNEPAQNPTLSVSSLYLTNVLNNMDYLTKNIEAVSLTAYRLSENTDYTNNEIDRIENIVKITETSIRSSEDINIDSSLTIEGSLNFDNLCYKGLNINNDGIQSDHSIYIGSGIEVGKSGQNISKIGIGRSILINEEGRLSFDSSESGVSIISKVGLLSSFPLGVNGLVFEAPSTLSSIYALSMNFKLKVSELILEEYIKTLDSDIILEEDICVQDFCLVKDDADIKMNRVVFGSDVTIFENLDQNEELFSIRLDETNEKTSIFATKYNLEIGGFTLLGSEEKINMGNMSFKNRTFSAEKVVSDKIFVDGAVKFDDLSASDVGLNSTTDFRIPNNIVVDSDLNISSLVWSDKSLRSSIENGGIDIFGFGFGESALRLDDMNIFGVLEFAGTLEVSSMYVETIEEEDVSVGNLKLRAQMKFKEIDGVRTVSTNQLNDIVVEMGESHFIKLNGVSFNEEFFSISSGGLLFMGENIFGVSGINVDYIQTKSLVVTPANLSAGNEQDIQISFEGFTMNGDLSIHGPDITTSRDFILDSSTTYFNSFFIKDNSMITHNNSITVLNGLKFEKNIENGELKINVGSNGLSFIIPSNIEIEEGHYHIIENLSTTQLQYSVLKLGNNVSLTGSLKISSEDTETVSLNANVVNFVGNAQSHKLSVGGKYSIDFSQEGIVFEQGGSANSLFIESAEFNQVTINGLLYNYSNEGNKPLITYEGLSDQEGAKIKIAEPVHFGEMITGDISGSTISGVLLVAEGVEVDAIICNNPFEIQLISEIDQNQKYFKLLYTQFESTSINSLEGINTTLYPSDSKIFSASNLCPGENLKISDVNYITTNNLITNKIIFDNKGSPLVEIAESDNNISISTNDFYSLDKIEAETISIAASDSKILTDLQIYNTDKLEFTPEESIRRLDIKTKIFETLSQMTVRGTKLVMVEASKYAIISSAYWCSFTDEGIWNSGSINETVYLKLIFKGAPYECGAIIDPNSVNIGEEFSFCNRDGNIVYSSNESSSELFIFSNNEFVAIYVRLENIHLSVPDPDEDEKRYEVIQSSTSS